MKDPKLDRENIFYIYGYMIGALRGKLCDLGIELSKAEIRKLEAQAIESFKRQREADRIAILERGKA